MRPSWYAPPGYTVLWAVEVAKIMNCPLSHSLGLSRGITYEAMPSAEAPVVVEWYGGGEVGGGGGGGGVGVGVVVGEVGLGVGGGGGGVLLIEGKQRKRQREKERDRERDRRERRRETAREREMRKRREVLYMSYLW